MLIIELQQFRTSAMTDETAEAVGSGLRAFAKSRVYADRTATSEMGLVQTPVLTCASAGNVAFKSLRVIR